MEISSDTQTEYSILYAELMMYYQEHNIPDLKAGPEELFAG